MKSCSVARSNGITKLEKSKRLVESLSPRVFSFYFKSSNSNLSSRKKSNNNSILRGRAIHFTYLSIYKHVRNTFKEAQR